MKTYDVVINYSHIEEEKTNAEDPQKAANTVIEGLALKALMLNHLNIDSVSVYELDENGKPVKLFNY